MIIYVIAFFKWGHCVPDDSAVSVQSIARTLAKISAACLTRFFLHNTPEFKERRDDLLTLDYLF